MTCPKCGFANDDNFINCKKCGRDLKKNIISPGDIHEVTIISDEYRIPETLLNKRFQVIKSLGSGGMGEIILAEDTRLKRKVAIKAISSQAMSDPDSRQRFRREAQTASQLDHPNICTIFEIASEENREYIVMQYIDGINLADLMKLTTLSLRQVVDISIQVCDGLIEAHAKGIIHRDIKPGNIMIDKNGSIKILDFGLAKPTTKESPKDETAPGVSQLTETGIIIGTAPYMSPEQINGESLDGRSDIFSFGVVMLEMLEKHNPFSGKDNIETLYNILNRNVTFKRCKSEKLKAIVSCMLEKDKKKRFSSFSQVEAALREFRAILPQPVEEPQKRTRKIDTGENAFMEQPSPSLGVQRSEDLSKMVLRWKRLKASTEIIAERKSRWKKILIITPVILLLMLFIFFGLGKHKVRMAAVASHTVPYLLLQDFENKTDDRGLNDKTLFLLEESLGQFDDFFVIREQAVREKLRLSAESRIDPGSWQTQLPVRYALSGELTQEAGQFIIRARLRQFPVPSEGDPAPFVITGRDRDSMLTDQVDNLIKRIYAKIAQKEAAEPGEFKKVSILFGTSWKAYEDFYQGMLLWNRKELDQASALLQAAEAATPPILAARYYKALIADYNEIAVEALNQLNPLMAQINLFPEPMKLKVLALRDKLQFRFQGEIENFQKLKDRFPFSKEILYQFGEVNFRRGQAEKAMREYLAALELDADFTPALNHLGYCYSYLGEHQKAIECLEKYSMYDQTANAFDSLGDGYFYSGDYTQSESNKLLALKKAPTAVYWAYLTLADTYLLKAENQKALAMADLYEKTAKDKKLKSDAVAKRAFISYYNREYPGAHELIQRAINNYESAEIADNTSEYHWIKGLLLLALGRTADCREEQNWLGKITERYSLSAENFNPAYKYDLHLSALLAEKDNRLDDAVQLFQMLISMKTQLSYWITFYNYPFFMSEYAAFLKRLGRREESLMQVENALKFNPRYPPALWIKYELFEEMKNTNRVRVLETLKEIYGETSESNFWRNRLKTALAGIKTGQ